MRVFILCLLLLAATPALADSQGGGLGTRPNTGAIVAPTAPVKPVVVVPSVTHESGYESVIGQASQLNSGDRADQLRQLSQQLTTLRQQEQALRQKLAQLQQKLAAEEDEAKRRALQAQIDATRAQIDQLQTQRAAIEARIREISSQTDNRAPEMKTAPRLQMKSPLKAPD
ncbi:MAG: hypothetical protein ACAH80_14235 [Alphaproteobacteria bacterium]